MNKKMIEEWATAIQTIASIISAVSLAAIALVAVMLWKSGGISSGVAAGTPLAPDAVPPAPVTQLTDEQWKKVTDNAPNVIGDANAEVVMVEFTDYQCPFCGQFWSGAYKDIKANYIDTKKIKYISRDLPLSFHANAHVAAQAARCAGDQNKFWEMHDKLFEKQTEWSELSDPKPRFEAYAKEIGINSGTLLSCINDGKYKQAVDEDNTLASEVGASGTPTFYINGKQLVGAQPYAEFERELKAALGE